MKEISTSTLTRSSFGLDGVEGLCVRPDSGIVDRRHSELVELAFRQSLHCEVRVFDFSWSDPGKIINFRRISNEQKSFIDRRFCLCNVCA